MSNKRKTPETPTKLTPLLAVLANAMGGLAWFAWYSRMRTRMAAIWVRRVRVGWDENLLVYKVVISTNLLTRRLLSLELDY